MGTILLVTSVRTHPVTADTRPEKVSIYKWLRLVRRKGSEGKMGVGSTHGMPGLLKRGGGGVTDSFFGSVESREHSLFRHRYAT